MMVKLSNVGVLSCTVKGTVSLVFFNFVERDVFYFVLVLCQLYPIVKEERTLKE